GYAASRLGSEKARSPRRVSVSSSTSMSILSGLTPGTSAFTTYASPASKTLTGGYRRDGPAGPNAASSMRSSSACSCSNGSRYTSAMTHLLFAGPPRHRGGSSGPGQKLRRRGALSTPAGGLLEQLHEPPLELGEPLAEGGLGLDLDLELAAGEDAHAAGVHGSERDDDRLAGDAEPGEDLEDALDLRERDGAQRHLPL